MATFDKAWDIVKSDDFERRQFEAKMNRGGKKHSCPTCKQIDCQTHRKGVDTNAMNVRIKRKDHTLIR